MNINGNTKMICLLGHPVEHSFSPMIHNYLFNKYSQNNKYMCFDVEEEELENAIKGVKSLGIAGCNVTIPHKVNIMKYIDVIDKNTRLIGAVNTIRNENGILKGYNTDGIGFLKSITDKGYDITDKKILIIGAGGACRSIAIELASKGVKEIEIRNRSIHKANEICEIINENFQTTTRCSKENIVEADLNSIDILINTTPIGMDKDFQNCPIDENIRVNKEVLVCDIVYNPHETKLIKWAKDNNLSVIYGIDMLINQAVEGFYIWTKIKVNEDDDIRDILKGI